MKHFLYKVEISTSLLLLTFLHKLSICKTQKNFTKIKFGDPYNLAGYNYVIISTFLEYVVSTKLLFGSLVPMI